MPTPFFADLVREIAQEGGTGPLMPTGAVLGHRRFADAVPPGVSFHYAVAGIARPEQWEVGTGRIGSDGRLLRETVAASSADGAAVDFAPGLKTIALTVGAGWFAGCDTQAATLAAAVTAFGGELADLAEAVEAKQPLSTTHGGAGAGEATDAVTVRRGAGWVNIPLSALAFRDADGGYALDGPVSATGWELAMPNGGRMFAEQAGSGSIKLRSSAALQYEAATAPGHQFFVNGAQVAQIGPANFGIGVTPLVKLHALSSGDIARLETTTARGGGGAYLSIHDPSGVKAQIGYTGASDVMVIHNAMNTVLAFAINGVNRWGIQPTGQFYPIADNAHSIGQSDRRATVIYATTGMINTSDTRQKTWRGAATDAELRAARRIVGELGFFQWNDAIAVKGADGARLHFGVPAQAVWAIMADEGLIEPIAGNATPSSRYAFLCHDQWDGEAGAEGRPAGDRFGIRADQLALFLIAAQDARLAALEAAT